MQSDLETAIREAEGVIGVAERTIEPVRRTLFRRFPVVFTLLVAFGVSATVFGIERVFTTISFFNDHPWRTLIFGLILLGITGKLYAKL